jgi:hypothetical protein
MGNNSENSPNQWAEEELNWDLARYNVQTESLGICIKSWKPLVKINYL